MFLSSSKDLKARIIRDVEKVTSTQHIIPAICELTDETEEH